MRSLQTERKVLRRSNSPRSFGPAELAAGNFTSSLKRLGRKKEMEYRKYEPDIYECANGDTHRYLLGKKGSRPLIGFGINPSKANRARSDATVTRVIRTGERNGYDGWLMMNVCAQRSTDPKKMHAGIEAEHHRKNKRAFRKILKTMQDFVCLGAWGNLIESRPYLKKYLLELIDDPALLRQPWFCYGLTSDGHPKHPSRVGYNQFQPFDIQAYLKWLELEKPESKARKRDVFPPPNLPRRARGRNS